MQEMSTEQRSSFAGEKGTACVVRFRQENV